MPEVSSSENFEGFMRSLADKGQHDMVAMYRAIRKDYPDLWLYPTVAHVLLAFSGSHKLQEEASELGSLPGIHGDEVVVLMRDHPAGSSVILHVPRGKPATLLYFVLRLKEDVPEIYGRLVEAARADWQARQTRAMTERKVENASSNLSFEEAVVLLKEQKQPGLAMKLHQVKGDFPDLNLQRIPGGMIIPFSACAAMLEKPLCLAGIPREKGESVVGLLHKHPTGFQVALFDPAVAPWTGEELIALLSEDDYVQSVQVMRKDWQRRHPEARLQAV